MSILSCILPRACVRKAASRSFSTGAMVMLALTLAMATLPPSLATAGQVGIPTFGSHPLMDKAQLGVSLYLRERDVYVEAKVAEASRVAWSLDAVDVDGDGTQDVLAAFGNDGRLSWFRNADGLGQALEETPIAAVSGGPVCVRAADLDGDGATDVLVGTREQGVSWYRNADRDGLRWVMESLAPGLPVTSLDAADMDADGDTDVLAVTADGRVVLLENRGGAWVAKELASQGAAYDSVAAVDPDGNGRKDVLAISLSGDAVLCMSEARASLGFTTNAFKANPGVWTHGVLEKDFNGDGVLDALSLPMLSDKAAGHPDLVREFFRVSNTNVRPTRHNQATNLILLF